MAAPGPLPPTVMAPDGTSVPAVTAVPTVQVPQKGTGLLSRHDMMMLFHREIPLATAKPVADGVAPAWAQGTNSLLKTAATDVTAVTQHVTTQVENLFHQLLPQGSDGGVTYKASVTIQKKLLVLDLTDLVADSGDDLAEVLGQHVSFQLVSTKVDPSKLTHPMHRCSCSSQPELF